MDAHGDRRADHHEPTGKPKRRGRDQDHVVSGAASFTPAGYQWSCNGTNLPGATSATLTLIAALFSEAGNYSVVVTNASGAATSQTAALTILPKAVPNTLTVAVSGTGSVHQTTTARP